MQYNLHLTNVDSAGSITFLFSMFGKVQVTANGACQAMLTAY